MFYGITFIVNQCRLTFLPSKSYQCIFINSYCKHTVVYNKTQ